MPSATMASVILAMANSRSSSSAGDRGSLVVARLRHARAWASGVLKGGPKLTASNAVMCSPTWLFRAKGELTGTALIHVQRAPSFAVAQRLCADTSLRVSIGDWYNQTRGQDQVMRWGIGLFGWATRPANGNLGPQTVHRLRAVAIVNRQEVARGYFPAGAYVSSNAIDPDYFSEAAERHWEKQVTDGMPFLHNLVKRKLAHAYGLQLPDSEEGEEVEDDTEAAAAVAIAPVTGVQASNASAETSTDTLIDGPFDDATLLSLENLVFVKPTPADRAAHKISTLPKMICAMIAVACNCRANAIPLANGLMALASGVSCRVNKWLHAFGLTTSRTSILQALDRLRVLQEQRLIDVFKANHKLLPLLCYDNIDINIKVHHTRVNASSRMFHGTWGFYIVFQAALQAKCAEDAVNLQTFLTSMASASRKPVRMSLFSPGVKESQHFVALVKGQLGKALREYAPFIIGDGVAKFPPKLHTRAPAVEPIAMHQANIHFLRMMDAPDNSAEGVSRVID
ncbi:uncharacterized protein MELLADRAFT_110576 [Melampsora larici-populina 98AG31]|uniref:Uncharacterized protein n=1 Tax=Melampsora larici-populina (strain 98AG31 / pathotype 3-4-7) TaxID=747676 RepID=F4S092_MELLP|nr:uncharacterized protein MELLADRAFT_110576 [Melampsora larici-populina 98AG31]EGG01976.1 hypothetical protein MELLADRAFT_110576 [Melampsora larici-populina 98AG31]